MRHKLIQFHFNILHCIKRYIKIVDHLLKENIANCCANRCAEGSNKASLIGYKLREFVLLLA